ncbi:MAG TPA: MFS transporter [Gammaproteobacteria bacterium]|nr:MFS transporter [Gammaproteobacteria bacterium]
MTRRPTSLRAALASSWAILLGFGILMLGDGLQGTLLPVRADLEGFSATLTGLIMSSFYLGFLLGSVLVPKITARVGHIRVFAALAALASAAILVHALFVTVPVWIAMRLVSGFCFAGIYIVAESWLNDRATNESRGRLLSLYMVVTYLGVGAGQLMLNLAEPRDFELFIMVSVLISVAVVPLLLSAGSPPKFHDAVRISLPALYRLTPLGIVSLFAVGLVTATFFALGPVYAQRLGLGIREISYFMTAAVIGTVLLQGPIGALSDYFDRRLVLTVTTVLTSLAALLCVPAAQISNLALLMAVALFGGLAFPLYSICIAYTNDHLEPEQMIAASGAMVLVGGLGAVSGPLGFAMIMDTFGNQAFFWAIASVHALTALFAIYRMLRSAPVPLDRQGRSYTTAVHPSGSAIDSVQQYWSEETGIDLDENDERANESEAGKG